MEIHPKVLQDVVFLGKIITRRCRPKRNAGRYHGYRSVSFRKYVKNQKCVREQIARMSSKAMFRVAEDVASLKQLLCLVSSALQRNAGAIEKLKIESAQVGGVIE